MRLSRLFVDLPLVSGQLVNLPKETSHYIMNVLRLRPGVSVIVFNGQGGEYTARLVECSSKMAQLQIGEYHSTKRESSLSLQLVPAIARPEHMDYTIQKAVELGVQQIIPVITERSPPLDVKLLTKREQHWRKIIISAAEQCGRNGLPTLHHIIPISVWLGQPVSGLAMVLSPQSPQRLVATLQPAVAGYQPCPLTVLVGAEGGLTEAEVTQASQAGYLKVSLGPRILRTETAAVAALAVCQALLGDW